MKHQWSVGTRLEDKRGNIVEITGIRLASFYGYEWDIYLDCQVTNDYLTWREWHGTPAQLFAQWQKEASE